MVSKNPQPPRKTLVGRGGARDFFERFHWRRWLMTAGLAILVALALSPNLLGRVPSYHIGEYNVGNYRAPFEISFVDDEATMEARRQAMDAATPVFEFNPTVFERTVTRLDKAFTDMHALYQFLEALDIEKMNRKEKAAKIIAAQQELKTALVAERGSFGAALGMELTNTEFDLLAKARFAPASVGKIGELLRYVYGDYITLDLVEVQAALAPDGAKERKIRIDVRGQATPRFLSSLAKVVTPRQVESSLEDLVQDMLGDQSRAMRKVLLSIATAQVKPNLAFNAAATAAAKKKAADNVVPVTIAFEQNELVIGDGVKTSRQIQLVFKHIRQRTATADWAAVFFGMSLLVFITLLVSFWLIDINIPRIVISDRDAMMMGILIVCTLFGLRTTAWFDERLMNLFPSKPQDLLLSLFPIAASVMLVRFLTRFETALTFAVVLTFLSTFATNMEIVALPMIFIVLLVGAHAVRKVKRRGQVLWAGLWVGLTFAGLALVQAIIAQDYTVGSLLVVPIVGVVNGLLSGVLVLGLAPVFEFAFGYMTDISLLELANYEHPLLKRLAHHSPGTYHHSIAISSLAEAATEAIGANSLLTRVGAMYHDVGKTANPRYFIENLRGDNPHETLHDPLESARVIIAHVPDGVRLAREAGLPQDIIDFIEQHHGTRAVTFFLEQARARAKEEGVELDESAFHYPGPPPQTKETAILMLCDIVEARSRTLEDRSPENVTAMIDKMIALIRAEDQFDQCPLTEPDIIKIVDALAGAVIGMQHERIAYPDQVRKRRGLFGMS